MNKSIGIFDSGYGGLTVFREIKKKLTDYDYIYLGDNSRMPYGDYSFQTIYDYTKECVFKLFDLGCDLVILACNTASAKALRTIQQNDLPPGKKVLGVIRPTTESIADYTSTKKVAIVGTNGTVSSESYKIEINKFFPEIQVFQLACPQWAPLAEQNDLHSEHTESVVKHDLESVLGQSKDIDVVVLACTHYPLLISAVKKSVPDSIKILEQGPLVATKLAQYLKMHPEIESTLTKHQRIKFYTTGDPSSFDTKAKLFYGETVHAEQISLS